MQTYATFQHVYLSVPLLMEIIVTNLKHLIADVLLSTITAHRVQKSSYGSDFEFTINKKTHPCFQEI